MTDLDKLLDPARLRSIWRQPADKAVVDQASALDCEELGAPCGGLGGAGAERDHATAGEDGGVATDISSAAAISAAAWAYLDQLERAIAGRFGVDSKPHRVLLAMIAEVRAAVALAPPADGDGDESAPQLAAIADFEVMLDRVEDVLLSFFYAAGWPAPAAGEAG